MIVVIWLIPTLGVLVTSFRPENLVDTTGWWTALGHPFRAGEWTLDNYRAALDAGGFSNAFLNSLAVTIPSTVMPITIAAFAAYAFSWMEFRGRYALFVLIVGLLVVPLQIALIPILQLYTQGWVVAGVHDHPGPPPERHVPRHLARAHRVRAAARDLPLAQLHRVAALVDRRVGQASTVPITSRSSGGSSCRCRCPRSRRSRSSSSSGCGTTCSSRTCSSAARPSTRVVTIALADLVGAHGENWQLLTAAAFLTMLLPLFVFFSLQRYFVRGLTAGSVKG